jgi:hypothetical protein
MAAWVRYSRQRFAYDGRLVRAPFSQWTATPHGARVVDQAAASIRFALFGRRRAAKRRLWRALAAAARDESVVAAIQAEIQHYFKLLGDLAYSDGLPRDTVHLRRLVVVPTVLMNGDMYGALETRLATHHAFTGIDGGDALRQFFIVELVSDLDSVATRLRPTLKNPVAAGRGWVVVGRNETFDWRVPVMGEPAWAGHYYVLELTREPITRAVRKAVEASMVAMEKALPSLARLQRNDILRRARRVA